MPSEQTKIPGFTEIEDDRVEEAAEKYRNLTDHWLAAQKPALEAEKELQDAVEKNKKILKAAAEHPRHKVKVGDLLLTIKPKDATLKISVRRPADSQE